MPLVLSDYTLAHLSNEQILRIVAETYAEPANWESYDIDTGNGLAVMTPWTTRDQGQYARTALEYIKDRNNAPR